MFTIDLQNSSPSWKSQVRGGIPYLYILYNMYIYIQIYKYVVYLHIYTCVLQIILYNFHIFQIPFVEEIAHLTSIDHHP